MGTKDLIENGIQPIAHCRNPFQIHLCKTAVDLGEFLGHRAPSLIERLSDSGQFEFVSRYTSEERCRQKCPKNVLLYCRLSPLPFEADPKVSKLRSSPSHGQCDNEDIVYVVVPSQ